jgi:hypothetical protein
VASFLVAALSALFVWYQAHLLRFSLQVQSLLALDHGFREPDMRKIRHRAAQWLLEKPRKGDGSEVDEVLDFLDSLGLLVKRGGLDPQMVWHSFFYWIDGYRNAARDIIAEEQRKNPRVWEDLEHLYQRLHKVENEKGLQRQEDTKAFLEGDIEQCKPAR